MKNQIIYFMQCKLLRDQLFQTDRDLCNVVLNCFIGLDSMKDF